ncbi:MAG: HAD family phosphatase [Bacteroidales bacterium]|nr:HAD family phosphatase [Bacteroidales bacterium]HPO66319.1 HAD family phosphatase [Bacteroidales bacterium]
MQSNANFIQLSADNLDNLLLDLGGVLVSIDFTRMANAFEKLGISKFHEMYSHQQQIELFDRFDRGQVSEDNFRTALLNLCSCRHITAEQFDQAWNQIIVDVPDAVLNCLRHLAQQFNLFVLSNTNSIHIRFLYRYLFEVKGVHNFEAYFKKVYYSYQMGYRKPEVAIFEQVLVDAKIDPQRTLFIDDTPANIEAAKLLGFQVFLMPKGKLLSDVIACE